MLFNEHSKSLNESERLRALMALARDETTTFIKKDIASMLIQQCTDDLPVGNHSKFWVLFEGTDRRDVYINKMLKKVLNYNEDCQSILDALKEINELSELINDENILRVFDLYLGEDNVESIKWMYEVVMGKKLSYPSNRNECFPMFC